MFSWEVGSPEALNVGGAFRKQAASSRAIINCPISTSEQGRSKGTEAVPYNSGKTFPSLTGKGRPSGSRSSARGEMPKARKIVA